MCGLFGMAGVGVQFKDLDVFRQLGIVSTLRGEDGSGVFTVNTRAMLESYRKETLVKTADDFLHYYFRIKDNDEALNPPKDFLTSVSPDLFLGHVRAATVGSISRANSHPYMFSNLVGAHNGTLTDREYLGEDKTDSELMFEDMNGRGIDKVLSELNQSSAYAITVYDRNTKRLIFARNDKRSLCVAHSTDRAVIYWASEGLTLDYILKRNKINHSGVTQFDSGKIFELAIGDINTKSNTIYNIRPIERKVITVPFVPRVVQGGKTKSNDVRKSSERVPYETCMCCKRPLGPLDQFRGTTNSDGTYLCSWCDGTDEMTVDQALEQMRQFDDKAVQIQMRREQEEDYFHLFGTRLQ